MAYGSKTARYARGGPVLGKESEFIKTPDRFRGGKRNDFGGEIDPNVYGKGPSPGDRDQAKGHPNPKVKFPKGK